MQCRCDYEFDIRADIMEQPFRSFAVIEDRDYERVMRTERQMHAARRRDDKLRACADASQYVTTVFECPRCGRLAMRSDDECGVQYYSPEPVV